MLWPGTLIGAGAGFAIASIPGAMLGALLGQALDRRLQLQSLGHLRERLGGRPMLRNDELLFVLLGRLAKSDGRVVDGHIYQARQEMRALEMNDFAQKRAIAAFNRGKASGDGLRWPQWWHCRRRPPPCTVIALGSSGVPQRAQCALQPQSWQSSTGA